MLNYSFIKDIHAFYFLAPKAIQNLNQYLFEIRPLSQEEGGGFLISFPDFSECISDGETVEEVIQNGLDALQETIFALEQIVKNSSPHYLPSFVFTQNYRKPD